MDENVYKPGEVQITYMSKEELAADRKRRERDKKRYPWRKNKRAMYDLLGHEIGNIRYVKIKRCRREQK